MIQTAEITTTPISGLYSEHIFDAPIHTEHWTWIKFETDSYDTFYGQFKGEPRQIAISNENDCCYVLTDLLLYEINRAQPRQFTTLNYDDVGGLLRNVTLTPSGQVMLSDYYTIFISKQKNLDTSKEFEQQITPIETSIMIDYIEFKEWNNHLLSIHALDFYTQQPVQLTFNAQTNEITQII